MTNNNQQFLIQHEEFDKNFIFPSVKKIDSQQVISLYENFKKILPHSQKYSKDIKVRKKLRNILDEFDVLFLDAFGVINIGDKLIPHIVETLNVARDKGIYLIILTNGATYCSEKKINQFYNLGLEFSYDEIISSRDVTERFLSIHFKPSKIGVLGNKDERLNIKNSLTIDLIKDIELFNEVDSFIFLGTSYWDTDFQDLLKNSLNSNPRPFFVSNPDIVAPHKDYFSIEPGYFSLKLINEGINLPLWFGKPFSTIFEMALEKVQFITGSSIDMSRIGMVGDTLHTDVLGANSIGIKSILMTKYGLLRNQNIASCIKTTGIIPDYLVEGP